MEDLLNSFYKNIVLDKELSDEQKHLHFEDFLNIYIKGDEIECKELKSQKMIKQLFDYGFNEERVFQFAFFHKYLNQENISAIVNGFMKKVNSDNDYILLRDFTQQSIIFQSVPFGEFTQRNYLRKF